MGDGFAHKTAVIFVRHGESEYNRAVRETGRDPFIRDAPLTQRGRVQAAAAKGSLEELRARFEVGDARPRWLLAVSPLRRALDTAALSWPEVFTQTPEGAAAGQGDSMKARVEVWPELREVISGCDDLGTTAKGLAEAYPHLATQFSALPEVWWTMPPSLRGLPADGDAIRTAFMEDPQAFEDAEEEAIGNRIAALVARLGHVPEEHVVLVAHCDLIGQLTDRLGLYEDGGKRPGWWLRNCECRLASPLRIPNRPPLPGESEEIVGDHDLSLSSGT